MNTTDTIKRLLLGERRDLQAGLKMLNELAEENRQTITGDLLRRLNEIEDDYGRMRDFMLRGFRDEHRSELYHSLLKKAYRLTCDFQLRLLTGKPSGAFHDARRHVEMLNGSREDVRNMLESFVQNVAMLSIESSLQEGSVGSAEKVYEEHSRQMSLLFEQILVSPQWSKADEEFYTDLMLSPTIDTNDARLLASAIMLAAMSVPDCRKLNTLVSVYEQAADEVLRQRCLVGAVFALPASPDSLLPEYQEVARRLTANGPTRKELVELQMQVFFCMNAEKDNATIQREIMPGLMKNQHFSITRFGIEEKDGDRLEEILHPDAEDKAMEELEANVKKMQDMHKAGADIYFGGFSHMKRYAFFYTLSNWFTPFYLEHPALAPIMKRLKGAKVFEALFAQTLLCDSDKYSFVFGMSSVFERLPENIRELIANPENFGDVLADADVQSPAYLRRVYLQDLFRFFRLYTQKNDFPSPFDYSDGKRFFFVNELLRSPLLAEQAVALERFLLKRRCYRELQAVLDAYVDETRADYHLMSGLKAMHDEQFELAISKLERARELAPGNDKVLKTLGQVLFACGHYDRAEDCYAQLLEKNPDNNHLALNHAMAQVNSGHAEEGLAVLYKLHYEDEDNLTVVRALAWGLMMVQRLEQAEKLYRRLLEHQSQADCLNAGYCMWFQGKMAEAVDLLKRYLVLCQSNQDANGEKTPRARLAADFANDRHLLDVYKIDDVDKQVVIDIVCG